MLAGRLERSLLTALPVLVVVEAPRLAFCLREHKRVVGRVARGEPEPQEVLAQGGEQRDRARAVLAGLAAGDDAAVDVLLRVDDALGADPSVAQRERILRPRAGVRDELGKHPLSRVARTVAQGTDQRLDLLDAERVDDDRALRRRLAHGADRIDRQLAFAHRVSADRLQHGQRLAHGRWPQPVRLERFAKRLHRRCRELPELEMTHARQEVAIPDLRVAVERVAAEPPASVVWPPVVLDERGQDDPPSAQLIQRASSSGQPQVGLVVEGVVYGVELLATPLTADGISPAHAERPDRTPRMPACLDTAGHLRLGRPLAHRMPMSSPTCS